MITDYIEKKLNQAKYKIIEKNEYFGEIPELKGVWASAKTLEKCRKMLREVLEDWLILKIKDHDKIPDFNLINVRETKKTKNEIYVKNYA